MISSTVPSRLILTWGNPSRGDDAVGPLMYEKLSTLRLPDTEVLTDFQLQIEHAQDLVGRKSVIFIDASVSCTPPCEFIRVHAEADLSYTTHSMSPGGLLSLCESTYGEIPPDAWLLSVKAFLFDLGSPLSRDTEYYMSQAMNMLLERLHEN